MTPYSDTRVNVSCDFNMSILFAKHFPCNLSVVNLFKCCCIGLLVPGSFLNFVCKIYYIIL